MTDTRSAAVHRGAHRRRSMEPVVRGLVAAAVLLSADIHLVLFAEGYSDIPIIGPLFLVNVLAGLALGVGLLISRHWIVALGTAGFGAATLGAFLVSRTVGLFGVRETMWDVHGVLAAVAEGIAIVGGIVLLLGTLRSGSAGR